MGIVNRLILFADASDGSANFIELMSVSEAARLPPAMAALLSGDEGIKSMVLSLGDVDSARAHFVALGCPFGPPVHVRREWRLSATESVWPEFDVLLPVNDVIAKICQSSASPSGSVASDQVWYRPPPRMLS